jgi:hypothetical protein
MALADSRGDVPGSTAGQPNSSENVNSPKVDDLDSTVRSDSGGVVID